MFEKSELTTTSTSGAGHKDSSSISPKRSKNLIKGDQNNNNVTQQNDLNKKEGNPIGSQQRLTPFR